MPAYVVVEVAVEDREAYERYKALAPESILGHGGRYLARSVSAECLEGDWAPERLVILEFPSLERARQWWSSEEYSEAKALRQASARTRLVVLDSCPPGG